MSKEKDSAHTPGPWRVERDEDELIRFTAKHVAGGKPNITIWADSEHGAGFFHEVALVPEDDIANARLIAAAPDLLSALTAIVEQRQPIYPSDWQRLMEQARAALAKAKE